MEKNELQIERNNEGYITITGLVNEGFWERYVSHSYLYYSEEEAIKLFLEETKRIENSVVDISKHFI